MHFNVHIVLIIIVSFADCLQYCHCWVCLNWTYWSYLSFLTNKIVTVCYCLVVFNPWTSVMTWNKLPFALFKQQHLFFYVLAIFPFSTVSVLCTLVIILCTSYYDFFSSGICCCGNQLQDSCLLHIKVTLWNFTSFLKVIHPSAW